MPVPTLTDLGGARRRERNASPAVARWRALAVGRRSLLLAAGVPAAAMLLGQPVRAAAPVATPAAGEGATPEAGALLAIDILLEPDATLVAAAAAANARLRGNYPAGFAIDATHAPHVSVAQRFVRAEQFDAVTAAVAKVLDAEQPVGWPLKTTGYDYAIWAGVALTVMLIERTPELERLQQAVLDAVAPYTVAKGTADAFATDPASPSINQDTITYVETFVPAASGTNFTPHVTVGVAHEDFVKALKAEPYTPVAGAVAGSAIYHLGDFGTAAKRLWRWKPS